MVLVIDLKMLCCSSRMLDDFGHEMDNTQSKMENTLSKVAKVMHLSSGKSKCLVEN